MRILILTLLFFSFQSALNAQALPEWFRVSTEEDSYIDLNTNYVMFSNHRTERVRFRWFFEFPQKFSSESEVGYKTILQEIQFDCKNMLYRTYDIKWFDENENLVTHYKMSENESWQEVRSARIMGKLYPQACKLIDLRRREPAIELKQIIYLNG